MYVRVMRAWLREVFHAPSVWMLMSLMFWPFALPLVTFGVAAGLMAYYARAQVRGDKVRLWPMLGAFAREYFWTALWMGLLDVLLLLLCVLTFRSMVAADAPALMRLYDALLLWINLMYLSSGFFRYPMMVCNRLPLRTLLVKGVLLTFSRLGTVFLLLLAAVTAVAVSALTGLGLLVFAPAGLALLGAAAYLDLFSTTNTEG